jgi:glycosyltransferase involved in cell wall biosynthesis
LSRWHRFFQDRYLRTAARSADVNTFPSAQLRDYLAAPLGLEDENLPAGRRGLVIPHIGIGYRPNRAHPREPNAFRICHAGNLSAERDPTPLFRALQKLAERNPDLILEFEIIGQINSAFETAAAELGIEKMLRIVPGMPYLACLDRLASADLQVLIEAPCDRGVFLPSKLADYNEVGQPILALSPRHGAVRDLIDQHGFGVFAANDSDEQVEAALAQCLEEHRETGASHPRKSALAKMAELIAPARVVEQIRLAALEAPMNSSLVMQ